MTWNVTADAWAATPFREAVAFLVARIPQARPIRDAIEAGASAEAFWVSDIAALSVVSDIFESINRAVANGDSFGSWRSAVIDTMRRNYPENMSEAETDRRVELVFRNSVQRAYSEGRYQQAQAPAVKRARPYFMYDAVLDSRTTELCKGLNGTILPQDDPFWDTHAPPLHHGCRSGLRTLSRRQVEARGGATQVPPTEPAQPGFGQRPGTAPPYRPPPDRYPPELTQALDERARREGAT